MLKLHRKAAAALRNLIAGGREGAGMKRNPHGIYRPGGQVVISCESRLGFGRVNISRAGADKDAQTKIVDNNNIHFKSKNYFHC